MDLLGNALLSIKVLANSIGVFDFGGEWGFGLTQAMPDFACSLTVLEGNCWFAAANCDGAWLGAGETAVVLNGTRHSFASGPNAPILSLIDVLSPIGADTFEPATRREAPLRLSVGADPGDGAPRTRILALAYLLREPERSPILSDLPPSFIIRREAATIFPWLSSLSTYLVEQKGMHLPGYTATASHLADLMFSSFLRARIASNPGAGTGWLKGVSDPQIGRVLSLVHARPMGRWSVAAMAKEANMAPSTFARRFAELLAQPPMDYVLGIRLNAARDMMLNQRMPIAQLAELAGYRSERAFRTAFTRRYGRPPRAYLKAHQNAQPRAD
ncbi:cupin domain-containing protein [Novosphingobium sp. KACC 22771]|uniref:cupin domain-containing protein n=1 Tax=Novosphingobium sp. KACC 22771 TaxID=3025670 RepID=UPI002366C729|nr:AraC family transcriptional regulator [Novosphingobium sp. KACC 22771]WDF72529.1 AraC family transcriptional regulator [Novosphingobium sp. KACC 22771]